MKSPQRDFPPSRVDGNENADRYDRAKKKSVSIAGLFKQTEKLRQPKGRDARHIFTPHQARINKQLPSSQTLFARPHKKFRSGSHPLSLDFTEAVHSYRDKAITSHSEQLEPVFEYLTSRVDGNHRPSGNEHISRPASDDDVLTLEKQCRELYKPLRDDTLTHQKSYPDGKTGLVDMQLGRTMDSFERKLQTRRDELEKLLNDLSAVEDEIAATRQEIVQAEESEVKDALKALKAGFDLLCKETKTDQDATLEKVLQGRQDDETFRNETMRKFQEFVNTLG